MYPSSRHGLTHTYQGCRQHLRLSNSGQGSNCTCTLVLYRSMHGQSQCCQDIMTIVWATTGCVCQFAASFVLEKHEGLSLKLHEMMALHLCFEVVLQHALPRPAMRHWNSDRALLDTVPLQQHYIHMKGGKHLPACIGSCSSSCKAQKHRLPVRSSHTPSNKAFRHRWRGEGEHDN